MVAAARRTAAWLGVACALAAVSSRADPPPGSARFAWVRAEGAESCADGATLAREIERRLGRPAFAPDAPRSIEAMVTRRDALWVARVFTREADGTSGGTREYTSDAADCAPVTAAVAFAVALVIDPEVALRPAPAPAVQAPAPAPATAPDPQSVACRGAGCVEQPSRTGRAGRPDGRHRAPRLLPRATATVRAVLAPGLVPGLGPGVDLAFDFGAVGPLRVATGALFLPEQAVDATVDGVTRVGLTAAWLGPCLEHPLLAGRVSVAGCVALAIGAVHSGRANALAGDTGDRLFVAGTASSRLRVRIVGPLVAEAGAELVVPIPGHSFDAGPSRDTLTRAVFAQWPVAPLGYLALGVSIW